MVGAEALGRGAVVVTARPGVTASAPADGWLRCPPQTAAQVDLGQLTQRIEAKPLLDPTQFGQIRVVVRLAQQQQGHVGAGDDIDRLRSPGKHGDMPAALAGAHCPDPLPFGVVVDEFEAGLAGLDDEHRIGRLAIAGNHVACRDVDMMHHGAQRGRLGQ